MTEQQIRAAIDRMSASKPIKAALLRQALDGNPSALFAIRFVAQRQRRTR